MPLYRVTDTETGSERFVEAKRIEQAVKHVVGDRFVAEMLNVERFEPEPPREAEPQVERQGVEVACKPPYPSAAADHDDEPTVVDTWRALA